jgi:hypothetical protein
MKVSKKHGILTFGMRVAVLAVLVLVSAILVTKLNNVAASDLSSDEKDAFSSEVIYNSCQSAIVEYQSKPDEIKQSLCGSYVRGLLEGFGAGAWSVAGHIHDDDNRMNALNRARSDMCAGAPENLFTTISDLVTWKQNPENGHGDFLVDLFTSIRDTCDRTKPLPPFGIEPLELRKDPFNR